MKFGNYRLIQKIATGGMAEVWLAEQRGIEGFSRRVVVKRILPGFAQDPSFVLMFLNEARVASQLSHPNIVQIHDLGERDGEYFLAMEYIHGRDLGRVMHRSLELGRWVSPAVALRIIADACAGLYYAHTREDAQGHPLGLVHRDISAQNILVSFNGSVKLVDFGIAKAANQSTGTQVGMVKGKFAYMSPEQATGQPLDARSDVFSLGLVLYELLTAVRPLKRDTDLATWHAATQGEIAKPSDVADVNPHLDTLVMHALAKDAGDRYADASAFQMAIEEYLVGNGLLVTSLQIADLLKELFPKWLDEKSQPEANVSQKQPGSSKDNSPRSGSVKSPEKPEGMESNQPQKPGDNIRSKKARSPSKEMGREPLKKRSQGQVESLAHEVTPVGNKAALSKTSNRASDSKQGKRGLSKLWVGGGVLGALVVVLLLVFFGLKKPPLSGIPVPLSVSTTPPTQVYVLRQEGKKRVFIGATPFENYSGVAAGETLLLLNEANNIHYEETIPMLAAGEVFSLQKKFEENQLKVLTRPENVVGVEIFRRGAKQPFAVVGVPIRLYEGSYELEFRGEALKAPVPFRAEIKPGKRTTQVIIDLRDFLVDAR